MAANDVKEVKVSAGSRADSRGQADRRNEIAQAIQDVKEEIEVASAAKRGQAMIDWYCCTTRSRRSIERARRTYET